MNSSIPALCTSLFLINLKVKQNSHNFLVSVFNIVTLVKILDTPRGTNTLVFEILF
jgi:hypothetical protein